MDFNFAIEQHVPDLPAIAIRLHASKLYEFSAGNLPEVGHLGAMFIWKWQFPDEAAWYVPSTGILYVCYPFPILKQMLDASGMVYTLVGMDPETVGESNALLCATDLQSVYDGWVQAIPKHDPDSDSIHSMLALLSIYAEDNSRRWNVMPLFNVKSVKNAIDTYMSRLFEMEYCTSNTGLALESELVCPKPSLLETSVYQEKHNEIKNAFLAAQSFVVPFNRDMSW